MWKIVDVKYRLTDGVVVGVTGEYRLTDGKLITRKIKNVELGEPSGDVIPFDDLTEEQVLTWFKSKIDVDMIEGLVSSELTTLIDKRDNKIIDSKLPWNK